MTNHPVKLSIKNSEGKGGEGGGGIRCQTSVQNLRKSKFQEFLLKILKLSEEASF